MEFIDNMLHEFVSLTISDILEMTNRHGSGKSIDGGSVGRLVNWLVGWLGDWLGGLSIGWLDGWTVG